MKTIVMINSGNIGSTGNIMLGIADMARKRDMTVYTSCPDGRSMRKRKCQNHIFIGNRISRNIHCYLGKYTGLNGLFSILDTKLFIKKLKKINPDIVHIHNLHNAYINLPILFKYFKKYKKQVIWTLHDCWSFTGKCPHFTIAKCEKWRNGCYRCIQTQDYPEAKMDCSRMMWKLKKKWFNNVENMTIVTPSDWLSNLVKESYLKNYSIKVINNGIDLSIFKPSKSKFREKYGISEEKKILLGVAFGWDEKKGLDVFIRLSQSLEDKYQIVLVGTDNKVDKQLPDKIISIHRTQNQTELAEIYTAADLFINPTREENYPTVNMEALACGTPVITFETGGSPEIIDDTCGVSVACDDVDKLEREIIRMSESQLYTREACLKRATNFDMNNKFKEYMLLYDDVGK